MNVAESRVLRAIPGEMLRTSRETENFERACKGPADFRADRHHERARLTGAVSVLIGTLGSDRIARLASAC